MARKKIEKKWTSENIRFNMLTKDSWLYRGLVAIYNRQTEDERSAELTKHENGVGFSGVDSNFLSRAAKYYKDNGFLTQKHRDKVRTAMLKYSGQLSKIANGEI